MKKTFKEYYGKEEVEAIHQAVDDLLEAREGGFIIIGNVDKNKITDAYMSICADHVLEQVNVAVVGAMNAGLLSEHD